MRDDGLRTARVADGRLDPGVAGANADEPGDLRVGVASVKRWELGLVQDEAMDELMRVKCDPKYGRESLEALRGLLERRCDNSIP